MLESIGSIIGANMSFNDAQSDDLSEKLNESPPPVPCEFCGKPREHKSYSFGNLVLYLPYLEPCDCAEGIEAYKLEQATAKKQAETEEQEKKRRKHRELVTEIKRESGMSVRFLQRTFDTFNVDDNNRAAYTAAKEYADHFDEQLPTQGKAAQNKNGLFIVGSPGTGKTHLAAAIANSVMETGKQVVFGTMIDLLGQIKEMFRYDGGESEMLRKYKTIPLLVIDDIGKEPPTDWAVSTIYNIINGRYEACLPTVVTSNYEKTDFITRLTPKETRDDTTARATLDRLREMCRGVKMFGESRRGGVR